MSASSDSSQSIAMTDEPPASPVKTYDRMDDLKLHLREAIAQPIDLIKQGTAPPPYLFAIQPSGGDQEQGKKFSALLGAAALARILAGMTLVQSSSEHITGGTEGDKPGTARHFSLKNPREYVTAFSEKTEAAIQAFTNGPVASMYGQPDQGAATSLDLEITRADLHAMILPRILGGLGHVGKTHPAELDKVLTSLTAALKSFRVPVLSSAQDGQDSEDADLQPDLKHTVMVHYVKSVDITGGTGGIYVYQAFARIVNFSDLAELMVRASDPALTASVARELAASDGPVTAAAGGAKRTKRGHPEEYRITNPAEAARAFAGIYQPRTRLIYMHVDASTWKWLTNKANHEESTFNMRYVVANVNLDVNKWLAAKPQLEAIVKKVTNATFQQYSKIKFRSNQSRCQVI
ncbi:hypothetical protein LY76DRAFT_610696 [Colletotrichum caudatum]|nr:hypothetical protein LY76DRAFT_610696 [Colletotrichum caudatum]